MVILMILNYYLDYYKLSTIIKQNDCTQSTTELIAHS